MIATILTAAAVYVATGIDYLVILILLFSQVKKGQVKHIWIGQYIGTVIVIGASLLVAQGVVNLIPQQWVIGLLGLLPLYLGVKMWIKGEEDEDESSILSRSEEHTSELQSRGHLVCRLLLEKKNKHTNKLRPKHKPTPAPQKYAVEDRTT